MKSSIVQSSDQLRFELAFFLDFSTTTNIEGSWLEHKTQRKLLISHKPSIYLSRTDKTGICKVVNSSFCLTKIIRCCCYCETTLAVP